MRLRTGEKKMIPNEKINQIIKVQKINEANKKENMKIWTSIKRNLK